MMLAIFVAAVLATKVVIFTPWAGDQIRPGLHVAERVTGACWTASLAVGQADAWRCMAGNAISDPCFLSSRDKNVVACVRDPFSRTVTLMQLTKPLPWRSPGKPGTAGPPWALRLANGATCGFLTGGTGAYKGERINYGCTPKGYVAGDAARSSKVWTATFLSAWNGGNATGPAQKVAVLEAVF